MTDFPQLIAVANLQSQLRTLADGVAAEGLFATATALRRAGDTAVSEVQSKLTVASGGAPAPVEPSKPKLSPATHLALVSTNSPLDGEGSGE